MPAILPYRRSYGRNIFRPKRRNAATKRAARGRSMLPMTRTLSSKSIYKFERYSSPLSMIQNTTAVQSIPWQQRFQLTDVQNYTDFTALFDSYKIDKITFEMQLLTNPSTYDNNAPALGSTADLYNETWFPVMWYVNDDDDETVPSLALLREKQGVKRVVLKPNKIIKFSIKPTFQKVVYQTATTVGYGLTRGWLDCVDASVPHYGIKGCIDFHQNLASTNYKVEVVAKFHLSFKGVQ